MEQLRGKVGWSLHRVSEL